jgi:hypothetical protein
MYPAGPTRAVIVGCYEVHLRLASLCDGKGCGQASRWMGDKWVSGRGLGSGVVGVGHGGRVAGNSSAGGSMPGNIPAHQPKCQANTPSTCVSQLLKCKPTARCLLAANANVHVAAHQGGDAVGVFGQVYQLHSNRNAVEPYDSFAYMHGVICAAPGGWHSAA